MTKQVYDDKRHPGGMGSVFNKALVPVALRGLEKMYLPEKSLFCDRALADEQGNLILSGSSVRYTAMSLIGLAMWQRRGGKIPFPFDRAVDRLVAAVDADCPLGDAGLILWFLAITGDERATDVAETVLSSAADGNGRLTIPTLSLGLLLTGLSLALHQQIGGRRLEETAATVYEHLRRRNGQSGLFFLGDSGFRKNIIVARRNARLGSFASQVYPITGLSHYAMATGRDEPLRYAEQCAEALCRVQGTHGQWWWIYDVRSGEPVVRYPVYSVHQDAMGPMALLAIHRAGGGDTTYLEAIRKSLDWFSDRPELPDVPLIRPGIGIIHRAIQRDDPDRVGRFGLGMCERFRLNLSAVTGGSDRRPFTHGRLSPECRPYHLGWILVAAALAEQGGGGNE